MRSLLHKLAVSYIEPYCTEKGPLPGDNVGNDSTRFGRVTGKKQMRHLSLSSIGHVIDKELLSDRQGHIYLWDPRYTNRDIESECKKQEILNAKFGLNFDEEKRTPMFTLFGMRY